MSKITFLIVDDDFISRRLVIKILTKKYQSSEMEILEAENGQEALDILENRGDDIDIIFLDMNMPVMNGPKFLEQLPEDTFIPIIVLTTDEKYKTNVLDAGATDFMLKPIQQEVLLSKIKDYLD